MNTKIILIIIILLGALLRVINISGNPPALYGDELTIVYDAYSLLKVGTDQLGNSFPLTFPMGAGRPAGYVYGSIPFVALFGPTALGVRMLSILSGIGVIILLFLISRKFFGEKVGIACAFIAAVSPWDISLSRGGYEAHFALFLTLLGTHLFIKASKKPFLYIFSAIYFGVTIHTYPTFKLTLPLFLILLYWYENGLKMIEKGKKFTFLCVATVLLLFFSLFSILQTFTAGSESRFSNINVFSNQELKQEIEQKINFERNLNNLPPSISKFLHNKPLEYSKVIGENYLQNFSLDFLFIHGDRNPRHNMANIGQLYIAEIILIFLGLVIFWQKRRKTILFLLLWLMLAPISTAIVDQPHALRSIFMLPPLLVLSAVGLTSILRVKGAVIIIGIIFFAQFIFFIQKLYFLSPFQYSNFWSYPAKNAAILALQNSKDYRYIILSDRIDNIEFAYPVYGNINPHLVIAQNQKKTVLGNLLFKKFGNVYIGYIPDSAVENFMNSLNGPSLYIGPQSDSKILSGFDTVDGLDGQLSLVLKKGKTH